MDPEWYAHEFEKGQDPIQFYLDSPGLMSSDMWLKLRFGDE